MLLPSPCFQTGARMVWQRAGRASCEAVRCCDSITSRALCVVVLHSMGVCRGKQPPTFLHERQLANILSAWQSNSCYWN
jgi:hypothetical protein